MHRDGGVSAGPTATGGGEGMERTISKFPGPGSGLRAPRMVSAPPLASAPMPTENATTQDLMDGMNALALDEQS